jgi:hypothetical protein
MSARRSPAVWPLTCRTTLPANRRSSPHETGTKPVTLQEPFDFAAGGGVVGSGVLLGDAQALEFDL